MKQKTKAFFTKALVGVFAMSLFVGAMPYVSWGTTANAATQKQAVTPYLEYTFNDSTNPWKNTGSATNGDMTKSGSPENVGGWGLKVADNGGIYLRTSDKNDSFVQTDEFTFSMSFLIDARPGWHGVPVSWTSFNTSQKKKVSRTYLLTPSTTTSSWLKFGDTDLTDSGKIAQQWYVNEGQELIPNNNSTNPSWTNLVVSIKAGGKAYVKARISNSTVYELEYDVPNDWTLFDYTGGDDFIFALGGSFTYNGSDCQSIAESKTKMQFDNVRFYDVAMTEMQIDKYISNVGGTVYTYGVDIPETAGGTVTADKTKAMLGETVTFTVTPDSGAAVKTLFLNGARVTLDGNNQFSAVMTADGMTVDASFTTQTSIEIRPELEYLFDSKEALLNNTGSAAGYTLSSSGDTSNAFDAGSYYFKNNSTLYMQTKGTSANNWFYDNNVDTFTVAFDTKAFRNSSSNWWQSAMNWVTLSDSSNAKTGLTALMVGYNSSHDWFGFTDSTFSTKKSGTTWYTNLGDVLYTGDKAAENSGWVRIVFSVQPGGKAYVKIYDKTTTNLLGSLSYDVPETWTPYASGSDFTFSLGGSFTKNGSYGSNESRYVGNMDNVRVYDFAMTETQMEEYAMYGKLLASGVYIAESANGEVTVDNHTPAIGEEVVFNVIPNAGYALKELKVNGETLNAVDGVYKTTMSADGLYVEATFEETMEAKIAKVTLARGASIRCGGIEEYSGLRFHMVATQADYEGLLAALPVGASVSFGMMIIPADYQQYATFTLENFFGTNAKYHLAERDENGNMIAYDGNLPQLMNFWTEQLYLNAETGEYEYLCSITKLKENNLTRAFVGVGLAKYTVGDEVTYLLLNGANGDFANNTRSMYQVAKLAVVDADTPAWAKTYIQKNYIDKVENAVTALTGKKVSILGDSISTFTGVSNNAEVNATIGDNEVFYNTQLTQADTWWQQAIDNNGMSLLVNNAWAGSNVATNYDNTEKGGCTDRAVNLHNVDNVTPDIIAVYMGINDCGCLTELGEFDEISDIWDGTQYVGDTEKFATAYAIMIHKIKTAYANADVFLFTLPRNGYLWKGTKEQYNALQDEYNKMIYKIAETFGCTVVDLATSVGENYEEYLLSDDIHPNAKGMDVITAAFETALYTHYLAANNQ